MDTHVETFIEYMLSIYETFRLGLDGEWAAGHYSPTGFVYEKTSRNYAAIGFADYLN